MRLTSRFLAPIGDLQVRESGVGDGSFTIRGHAAVFNKLSHDLGGFQEQLAPGAFTNALSRNPDVLAVWDHDTRYTLARTLNGTLELREDPYGLHNWMRVAPTSYAADLRILMERGDITQASFMFTIAREAWSWSGNDDDPIIATIEEVGDLYDVTVTGRGAYPQTDQSVVTHARTARLAAALREGRVDGLTLEGARERGLLSEDPEAAPGEPAAEDDVVPTETDSVDVETAERSHRLAVEQAKRRRAGAKRPE